MPLPIIPNLEDYTKREAAFGKDEVLKLNPQRYEFEQLDNVIHLDIEEGIAVGSKLQTDNEFWIKGHIPGRPLMPGVLMIEMAAQLCSFYYHKKVGENTGKFFGFGGVDKVKFRGSVLPKDVLVMVIKAVSIRSRIALFQSQGFVDNKMVFEGIVTGVIL